MSRERSREEWMREARDGRYHPFQADLAGIGCRWCTHDRQHPIHDPQSVERRLRCSVGECLGVPLATWEVAAHMHREHGVLLCGLDHWRLTQSDFEQITRFFRSLEATP